MVRWLIIGLVVIALAVAAIRIWSGKVEKGLVFFPERDIYTNPGEFGLDYEDVFFVTSDGVRLHGWFVRGPREGVLLWFHGNAGNIADRVDNLARLVKSVGISVFIFDYREYGKSEGQISKAGTFIDADASYSFLVNERKIPPEKIVLFGRSLGSALAVYLAAREKAAALIIESAFTSSEDVADLYYPFLKHLVKTSASYRTLDLIGKVTVPKLIIHGVEDEIIPFWMGKKLYEAASSPKKFYPIEGAGHNDTYFVGGHEYFRRIGDFIGSSLGWERGK